MINGLTVGIHVNFGAFVMFSSVRLHRHTKMLIPLALHEILDHLSDDNTNDDEDEEKITEHDICLIL